MGRKNVLKSFKMYDAADISGDVTSATTNVENLDQGSIAITWTGTSPEGVLTVEAKNGAKDAAFKEIDMGGTITITGNTGDHRLLFNQLPFTNIRLVFTSSSGTGTMEAVITAKQVGG